MSLEDKVMDKKVSFSLKDIKWVIITSFSVVLWLVTAFLWVSDKNRQAEKINKLETTNITLEKEVATLKGQIRGVENATTIFMENPPKENKVRIDQLEKRIDILEKPGSNQPYTFIIDTNNIVRRGH